mmetsp:Transcript_13106/g.28147  ORF Transcript_13106/g.28147 Transcript_13106/m.28147 type:complete len:248 (-) Transcript_13106:748-1491(-)
MMSSSSSLKAWMMSCSTAPLDSCLRTTLGSSKVGGGGSLGFSSPSDVRERSESPVCMGVVLKGLGDFSDPDMGESVALICWPIVAVWWAGGLGVSGSVCERVRGGDWGGGGRGRLPSTATLLCVGSGSAAPPPDGWRPKELFLDDPLTPRSVADVFGGDTETAIGAGGGRGARFDDWRPPLRGRAGLPKFIVLTGRACWPLKSGSSWRCTSGRASSRGSSPSVLSVRGSAPYASKIRAVSTCPPEHA